MIVESSVTSADGTAIAYRTLGGGPSLLILGGSLRSGEDYLPLARELAARFRVHVIDRRGRGQSGPQGDDYGLERELEDLRAVQTATAASAVFGHSYGGLIALEAAREPGVFSEVIVYEPGISVSGSIPSAWLEDFRARLQRNDPRGAFTTMVRGAGHAPSLIRRMPFGLARRVLAMAIPEPEWSRTEALLHTQAAEHGVVCDVDDGSVKRYRQVSARVLALGGSESPAFQTTELFARLQTALPQFTSEILDGLGHLGPDEEGAGQVAEAITRWVDPVLAPPG